MNRLSHSHMLFDFPGTPYCHNPRNHPFEGDGNFSASLVNSTPISLIKCSLQPRD